MRTKAECKVLFQVDTGLRLEHWQYADSLEKAAEIAFIVENKRTSQFIKNSPKIQILLSI